MKKQLAKLALLFISGIIFTLPVSYAIEDCGTSVTECQLKEQIKELQQKVGKLFTITEKQQATINAQQKQLTALKQEIQRLNSPQLRFLRCGGLYCTPRMCLNKCISLGLRMATYDELYAWASAGKSECAGMWMLNSKFPDKVYQGYPMYVHNPAGGCGRTNLKNIPRIG